MKQTVGFDCNICGGKISVIGDGTWCPSCLKEFHIRCRDESESPCCPNCGETWVDPTTLFVYGEFCPLCATTNEPCETHCRECRQPLRWDTPEEFDSALGELSATGNSRVTGGMMQMLGGAAVLAVSVVSVIFFTFKERGRLMILFPTFGLGLLGWGFRTHRIGRNLQNFVNHHRRR